ncbi:hypothetical protein ACF0H5_010935 [Mactra antiquata]
MKKRKSLVEYRFYFGRQLVVVLTGYDIIHEALVVKKEAFSGRAKQTNVVLDTVFPGGSHKNGIIFREYGEEWKHARRFTLQSLRDFGVGKTTLEDRIIEEVNAVASVLDSMNGKSTTVTDLLLSAVTNVLFSIVFGNRYAFEDPEFKRLQNMTNTILSGSGQINPSAFLPRSIARLLNKKEADHDLKKIEALKGMKEHVIKQIEQHEITFDKDNFRDFIDIYIDTCRNVETTETSYITKQNMFRIIIELFIAGAETTAASLQWMFLCMIEFTDVQNKCREEITKVVGDKPVHYNDRNNLPYVNAVIAEIQRFGNIVPLNMMHCTTQDTSLDGYDIPKGTSVMPMLYSVSIDEKYFPEPTKFKPDRFLNENGELKRCDAHIPFSAGPRICLGEVLARMELFMIFTHLLQNFKFEREDPNKHHSFDVVSNKIAQCPLPYKLRAIRIH